MKRLLVILILFALATTFTVYGKNSTLFEVPEEPPATEVPPVKDIGKSYLKFVDKNGNPVGHLIADYINFTDEEGKMVLSSWWINQNYDENNPNEPFDLKVDNDISGESDTFKVWINNTPEAPIELVWEKDSPIETVEKMERKVQFRFVDKNGKPIEGLYCSIEATHTRFPTDKEGKMWYFGESTGTLWARAEKGDVQKWYKLDISEEDMQNQKKYKFVFPG